MPDDAKFGLLAGVIGVVVVATVYHGKRPAPAARPDSPAAVATTAVPPATVPPRPPAELDPPAATRPEAPAAAVSYPRR